MHGKVRLIWEETTLQGAQGIATPWGIPSRDGKRLAINGTYPSPGTSKGGLLVNRDMVVLCTKDDRERFLEK